MPLSDIDNFVAAAFGTGQQKGHLYFSNDLLTEIDDNGYFDPVFDQIHKGDLIWVSSDVDGSGIPGTLQVTSATGVKPVTVSTPTTSTVTLVNPTGFTIEIDDLGTAQTKNIVVTRAGTITDVYGVANANGPGSGGTSTISISVPGTGVIATLPFLQSYIGKTAIHHSGITAHALAAGAVVSIIDDGVGTHVGPCTVNLTFTPS